ncbi:MAG: SRPBCC family protein [Actinomycetia bacterium]|nr:SRPBCC family protein [Actinomycetes bacterium]MCH9700818.1 SRPBCC family protein [Actinomycetes bacterium]MCH9762471.1 SRPBCC family protein [Actinomycetes bacterium]
MVTVERSVAAPADRVWRVLVDLDAWPLWGPSVRGAELDGGGRELGRGSRGSVDTALGFSLPFVVTEFDAGRYWAWEVGGVPATGHEVIGDVVGCRVRFGVPWWAVGYLPVCAVALGRVEAVATGLR